MRCWRQTCAVFTVCVIGVGATRCAEPVLDLVPLHDSSGAMVVASVPFGGEHVTAPYAVRATVAHAIDAGGAEHGDRSSREWWRVRDHTVPMAPIRIASDADTTFTRIEGRIEAYRPAPAGTLIVDGFRYETPYSIAYDRVGDGAGSLSVVFRTKAQWLDREPLWRAASPDAAHPRPVVSTAMHEHDIIGEVTGDVGDLVECEFSDAQGTVTWPSQHVREDNVVIWSFPAPVDLARGCIRVADRSCVEAVPWQYDRFSGGRRKP